MSLLDNNLVLSTLVSPRDSSLNWSFVSLSSVSALMITKPVQLAWRAEGNILPRNRDRCLVVPTANLISKIRAILAYLLATGQHRLVVES